jgi:hypothetical protein
VPAGSLAPVATVLTSLAGEPGVPAPAAAALTSVAGTLDGAGAIDPTSLRGPITTLQGVAGTVPAR